MEVNPGKLLPPVLSPFLVANASSWLIPCPFCPRGSGDEDKLCSKSCYGRKGNVAKNLLLI